MYATDPNTTPKPYTSYKKEYNGSGLIKEIKFYNQGVHVFSWVYTYDDAGTVEMGCEIIIAKN